MMIRAALIIGVLVGAPYSFGETLCREIGRAFWFAWNDAVAEIDAFRRHWRANTLEPPNDGNA